MLKYLSETYLNSDFGSTRYYFIGIGALVIILVVAAAAIFLSPDLQDSLNLPRGEKLEKSRVAGKIIDINYDEEYFVIDDEETGEEFKINLPEGTQIKTGGIGSGTYTLIDLEIGQYIELTNVKYTSSGGGSGGRGLSGGSSGGGGSNNNGGGDNNQNEVDDWEDINVYFPYDAFSSEILSIDIENSAFEVKSTSSEGKVFTVLVSSDTVISSIDPTYSKNVVKFSELKVGWEVDIFPEEDPSENLILNALIVFIFKASQ